MNAPITLDTLAAAWVVAKASEDRAKAERYEIEKSMLALLPVKEEGTVSSNDASGMKISATYKLTRKADADALKDQWGNLSPTIQAAFTWKPDVSITQLRALEKAAPEDYATALHFITTSPAKPSIKIESK